MKIAVSGSRPIHDREAVFKILDSFFSGRKSFEIVVGDARGVDRLVREWASLREVKLHVCRAEWERYGRRAGFVRNEKMAKIADELLAVWDGKSSRTAHMVITMHRQRKPVKVVLRPVSYTVWSELDRADAICVTTNGFVVKGRNGPRAVMGRGVAYQLKVWLEDAEESLAQHILENGNSVGVIGRVSSTEIVAFPVKGEKEVFPCPVVRHAREKFYPGDVVPGFLLQADLSIIRESADQLAWLIDTRGWKRIVLPKPGCGAGELSFREVLRVLLSSDLRKVSDKVFIADYDGPRSLSSYRRSAQKRSKSALV